MRLLTKWRPLISLRDRFVLVLLFLLLLGFQPTNQNVKALPQIPQQDWPQFRGNLQLTGVALSSLPATLKLLWTYEAGDSIESSAAIVDATVYVGSQSGELVALNLTNGTVRWKYRTNEGIGESSPCVGQGVVYVGDLSGVLHAVNASDGKKVWIFKTNGEIKSSPVLVDDRVLVGSYDEHLYCLSARDGSLLWKFRINGPVHCTAGVADGIAYISGCDETFRAVRISDGKEIFHISSGAYTGASPALTPEAAYFGTFGNEVLGVNLRSRRVTWRYQHPKRQFPFYSSAAVVDGKLIVGGRDKGVHCLNAKTGKVLWTFLTKARVESSPAVASGRVYVGSNDGRFYVLDLNKGTKLWEFLAGAPLSASPAIAAGRVVIGSQDGRLYCFG
ncbi:MAG: serine/threonine protein kinase [Acidobacteria bacterium]|nr:MAG: serine/threonine protein kinase [Acidobacteriota bacterium]